MITPIRVVVADDHPLFRFGLSAALQGEPDIDVVAEAVSGADLLRLAMLHRPDVVVTDVGMPDMDGVAATSALRRSLPEVGVLVLTMHEDDATVLRAVRAGARGYLVKGATLGDLASAVRSIAAGHTVYGAGVADILVDAYEGASELVAVKAFPQLTPREREILDLVARGLGNVAVGVELRLSEKTVRNVLASILVKLQAPDRAAATAAARAAGLGALPAVVE